MYLNACTIFIYTLYTYPWDDTLVYACRFNRGETRFSLRVNPFETLRCAVAGRQEYILMESSHATDISQEWLYNQGYVYGINVDKVDLKRYPNVANVPWYKAVVDEGDCLYLPFHWIHQVRGTP